MDFNRRLSDIPPIAPGPCGDGRCELRLQRIEFELDLFKDELNDHVDTVKKMTLSLDEIQNTLRSIKFMVLGALGIYALQIIGVEGLLKHFFGG